TLFANAQRLGIKIIAPVLCDIHDFKGPRCHRVLFDAPCSGWGVVGKNSDLRWSKSKKDSLNLAETQGRLLRHAATLVNPGGVLVYSTCTIIRDENDQVVEEFLLERRDFTIDSAAKTFPKELVNERGFVKTYPDFENLDGGFCVRLKKRLLRLAQVESVYVPGFYDAETRKPVIDGVPEKIIARHTLKLQPEYYPSRPIVPLTEITHDRVTVEIMRGCPQRCRFCQASRIYRPVRLRSIDDIKKQVMANLKATGHDEVGLLSLSTSDYPDIDRLTSTLVMALEPKKIALSLPSLRPG
ncbi:unnamed protein product, partial [marine sediment metagenome]